MKLRILAYLSLVLLILVWPPVYSYCFEKDIKVRLSGRGNIEDFELQYLFDVKRWVIDIPDDKDGWALDFQLKSEDKVESRFSSTVRPGQVVLMMRRDTQQEKVFFCWYQDGRRCYGSFDDPIPPGTNLGEYNEGELKLGEPVYFGTKGHTLQVSPLLTYDFEVRVDLKPSPFKPR